MLHTINMQLALGDRGATCDYSTSSLIVYEQSPTMWNNPNPIGQIRKKEGATFISILYFLKKKQYFKLKEKLLKI